MSKRPIRSGGLELAHYSDCLVKSLKPGFIGLSLELAAKKGPGTTGAF